MEQDKIAEFNGTEELFVARLLIVTVVTCLVFSYLWSLFRPNTVPIDVVSDSDSSPKPGPFLDPITVTTLLVLIDVLYVLFIAIQFSYLFGSLKSGLPHNFTYAQYARKGFFELVVVTLINLVILLGNMNFVKASGGRIDQVVKVLNTALVVGTFIILLSAHFRMSLYEQAYKLYLSENLNTCFYGIPVCVVCLVDFMHSTSNQELAKQLEKALTPKKHVLERTTSWQSFNISKYRARKVLLQQNTPQSGINAGTERVGTGDSRPVDPQIP